jgi:hypothetical protein
LRRSKSNTPRFIASRWSRRTGAGGTDRGASALATSGRSSSRSTTRPARSSSAKITRALRSASGDIVVAASPAATARPAARVMETRIALSIWRR